MTGTAYVCFEDTPLERFGDFNNFALPPLPAAEVIMILASGELSDDISAEVRKLLIDELVGGALTRAEVETMVDEAIAAAKAS